MNLKYVVDEKNHIEVEFLGEDYSIPAVLKEILLKNKDVEFVTYIVGHPSRDSPRLVLKTSKSDAKKILKEAVKEATETFEEMKKALTK